MQSSLSTLLKFDIRYYLIPRFENKKKKRQFIALFALLVFAFLFPIIGLISMVYKMAATVTNAEELVEMLSALFLTAQITTIFFGVYSYLQIMYLSKDSEFLLTLPAKTSDIFLAKLITTIISEMIVVLAVVIPSTIVTAISVANSGVIQLTAWYYILIPIAIITLPFLPIMLIAIVSFPIMKLVSFFKKHQTIGAIIGALLICGLVAAIYIPLYSNIYGNPDSEDIITEDQINSIIGMGKYSFHTLFLAKAMLNINAGLNALFYLLIMFGFFAVGILLAVLLYKNSLYEMNDKASITKKVKTGEEFKVTDIKKALLNREIKVITRDSQKFINILMSVIMAPLMTGILIFVMNTAAGAQVVEEGEEAFAFSSIIYAGFASCFTVIMLGGSNVGSSVGFSLEGQSFSILKTLPIQPVELFKAKMKFNDILALISIAIVDVLMVIVTDFNVIDIIGLLGTSFVIVSSVETFALKRDLKNPKTNWTNIKEITKNNFSTMIPMLIILPAGIVAIVLGVVLEIFAGVLNKYLISLILWAAMAVIALIYYLICKRGAIKKVEEIFNEIEA